MQQRRLPGHATEARGSSRCSVVEQPSCLFQAWLQAWFQARLLPGLVPGPVAGRPGQPPFQPGPSPPPPSSFLCLSVQALNIMGTLVVQEQAGGLGLSNLGRGVSDWTCQSSSGVFGPAVSRPTYKCCSSQPDLALQAGTLPPPWQSWEQNHLLRGLHCCAPSQTCTSTCACCPRGWK